ncbi:MAG: 4-hydroxy-tetrahydrodipicolinate synthase [Zoogloeaceae bacterium]|jgi:4-hydroxy-tetrahydrodipicolinate synthase|nr:4-hydroxy-tetrahydrodipicolinate synthase [Zoogloeaceae bacterium]
MIYGSLVALVTPMLPDGKLDFPALRRLVEFHVTEQSDAIVIVGTTGESPTVNTEEHHALIARCVEYAAGRIPVIAGTGANATDEAIALARFAKSAGASATLSVVPYYNKPGQEGIYRHFATIADKTDIGLILYNVPGRTGADMSNETALRLAQLPNVIGLKDATGNIARACDLVEGVRDLADKKEFALYSGDDATALASLFMGFHGVISVTANIAPRMMRKMCAAARAGNLADARELHFRLNGLHRDLFCEANPIPVKWAAQQIGLIEGGIRLPLTPLSVSNQAKVTAALRQAGIQTLAI